MELRGAGWGGGGLVGLMEGEGFSGLGCLKSLTPKIVTPTRPTTLSMQRHPTDDIRCKTSRHRGVDVDVLRHRRRCRCAKSMASGGLGVDMGVWRGWREKRGFLGWFPGVYGCSVGGLWGAECGSWAGRGVGAGGACEARQGAVCLRRGGLGCDGTLRVGGGWRVRGGGFRAGGGEWSCFGVFWIPAVAYRRLPVFGGEGVESQIRPPCGRFAGVIVDGLQTRPRRGGRGGRGGRGRK